MNPFPGYLAANLTVAANLRLADELEHERAWFDALVLRLEALGWRIAGQEGLITPDGEWCDWPEDDNLEAFVVQLEADQ